VNPCYREIPQARKFPRRFKFGKLRSKLSKKKIEVECELKLNTNVNSKSKEPMETLIYITGYLNAYEKLRIKKLI